MTGQAKDQRALERKLIVSRREYSEGADRLLNMAQHQLRIFDPDLNEIRLELPARIGALKRFLQRSRDNRLWIAVHDPAYIRRFCPRLVILQGLHADRLLISRTEGEAAKAQDCFVLADGLHMVRRPVARQARGVLILNDPAEGLLMHERFEQIWECSEPAVSASTSGL